MWLKIGNEEPYKLIKDYSTWFSSTNLVKKIKLNKSEFYLIYMCVGQLRLSSLRLAGPNPG